MSVTRRVFSALALGSALALAACGGNGGSGGGSATDRASDRVLGNADASLTMVEYASVACGHCATFHNDVWPALKSEYVETGQMRFIFREMITGSPQFAVAGFSLAHCVPEDRYFDMIDLLFQQQRAIFSAASGGNARSQYLAIARSMGLSEAEFNACLSNEDINATIMANHEQAQNDGIDGTPRFLFNGQMLEARRAPGSQDYIYYLGNTALEVDGEPVPALSDVDTFRTVIDYLLAQQTGAEG